MCRAYALFDITFLYVASVVIFGCNKHIMEKYIIDVDTGIDDAFALILASKLARDEVIGITTCAGNVTLEDALSNTLKMVELLSWNVPVFKGASKTITGNDFVNAYHFHGSNGLGEVQLGHTKKEEQVPAVDFIIESTKRDQVHIICLAAPTNLASAILKDPTICQNIKTVFLMGGAINCPGNVTKYAEFNFFQDPPAVQTVLKNIKNCHIVPLDITNQYTISEALAERIKENESDSAKFVKEVLVNWYRFFGHPEKKEFDLCDPLALVAAVLQGDVDFEDMNIGITLDGLKKGRTFVGGEYAVKIVKSKKGGDFIDFFLKNIV